MTNSMRNLHNHAPYTEPEQVYIGDGKCLPILNSGTSTMFTPNHAFSLKNVLHVPHLKQNFLSANQFSFDNWRSISLYPFHFTVKDLS